MLLRRLSTSLGLLVLIGAAGAGCASAPLARTAAPSQSRGVAVALSGQRCDRENDPGWSVADMLDLTLQVSVANDGDTAVFFDPWALQLIAAGMARAVHRADSAGMVLPGTSRVFAVRFLERDDRLACNVPMTLALARTARVSGTPIALAPIPFLASNDDI
ncbi:MAG TPA: hypothetical protein VMT03_27095 [Polyangia bacterium]|nr:hypothetical protein [Polyangia bacterium]